jgi:hypothetical protein
VYDGKETFNERTSENTQEFPAENASSKNHLIKSDLA